jgi:hypothetical protein
MVVRAVIRHTQRNFLVSKYIRSALILVLAVAVAAAYSPASFADKKGSSNSSNSEDKKDKDKDKNKDKGDQNNQRQGRDRQQSDDNVSNAVQQFQKSQQNGSRKQSSSNNQQNTSDKQSTSSDKQKIGSDKQSNSKSSQPVIINPGAQNIQLQKSPSFQNLQKQQLPNNQKPNSLPPNLQQFNKDKWQDQNNKNKWQNQSHKDHKELHKWVDNFGGAKPFSSKWYKDHPKAWHHKHHDHDDWKFVTAAGLVGFLGWQAYHSQGPVIVYQPVPYDTLFVNRPGVIIDPNRGEWMPLGVYSLMVGPGDESTRMLDLVVDRFGHIRGSYYDMISDSSYNVAGIIDGRTQYAQWSLESNRQLTFYTPIGEMMQPQSYVNVQLPSGQRQQWQLVRMEPTN